MTPNNQKLLKYIYIYIYTAKSGGGSTRLVAYSTPPNFIAPAKLAAKKKGQPPKPL
jgi:hypothetical protein